MNKNKKVINHRFAPERATSVRNALTAVTQCITGTAGEERPSRRPSHRSLWAPPEILRRKPSHAGRPFHLHSKSTSVDM